MAIRERWIAIQSKLALFMVLWRARGLSIGEAYEIVKKVSVDVEINEEYSRRFDTQ